ncbi:MAG TPA: BamA/TamA family outer membrane protein, partial [bacterium]|nr:BamA/TamA family outer membrane protein [bacterium]
RLGLLALCTLPALPVQGIERRKPQFQTEPAYLFVPFPYDLPGIGNGIAWTGLGANLAGTHADLYGMVITGDAGGQIAGLEDVHLVPERLILSLFYQNINRATARQYPTRGMQSSGDLYTLIEASQADQAQAELRLTLSDRRYEFYVGSDVYKTAAVRMLDPNGVPIIEFAEPFRQTNERLYAGVLVDQTDDYADPRRGVRLEISASRSRPATADDPDFVVWNYSLNGYIPIGPISTLVLRYFQSDADMRRQGNTSPLAIAGDLGCSPLDPVCQAFIAQIVAEHTYGTSATLGGTDMLRSFPMSRFQGAHTVFYAAEFRWNITEEVTPFDYFIWKDVRTNVQLAFFAETGSVGETRSEVGGVYKSSYGMGLRMISGSGFVYRADVATGDEGGEATIIFMYPF